MINSVVRQIVKEFKINKFVETGILNGESLIIAQDIFCELYPEEFNIHANASTYSKHKIYEVDLNPSCVEIANNISKGMNNIIIKCDYSDNFLKYLFEKELDEQDSVVFHCDAHGHRENREEMLKPLQNEMMIISKSKLKNCIIFIDDWKVEGKRHDHYSEEDVSEYIKNRTNVIYHSKYPNIHKKYCGVIFLDKSYNELNKLLKNIPLEPIIIS